jgi:hypothetical protein
MLKRTDILISSHPQSGKRIHFRALRSQSGSEPMRADRRRVMFHLRGGNGELMGNFALRVNGALYTTGTG